jgi:hypothetical protein
MCSLNGLTVTSGWLEITKCEDTFDVKVCCPGVFSAEQLAGCVGGSGAICESGGCTFVGEVSNVCCSSCGSYCCMTNCTVSET